VVANNLKQNVWRRTHTISSSVGYLILYRLPGHEPKPKKQNRAFASHLFTFGV